MKEYDDVLMDDYTLDEHGVLKEMGLELISLTGNDPTPDEMEAFITALSKNDDIMIEILYIKRGSLYNA